MVTNDQLEINVNLTDNEWTTIKDFHDMLLPFMSAQQVLEGKRYATISLVLGIITTIKNTLVATIEDAENKTPHVQNMTQRMLTDFYFYAGVLERLVLWYVNKKRKVKEADQKVSHFTHWLLLL